MYFYRSSVLNFEWTDAFHLSCCPSVNKCLLSPVVYQGHCWLLGWGARALMHFILLWDRWSTNIYWALTILIRQGLCQVLGIQSGKDIVPFIHRIYRRDTNKNNVVDTRCVLWWRFRPSTVKSSGRKALHLPRRVEKEAFEHRDESVRWIRAWRGIQGRGNNTVKSTKTRKSS